MTMHLSFQCVVTEPEFINSSVHVFSSSKCGAANLAQEL